MVRSGGLKSAGIFAAFLLSLVATAPVEARPFSVFDVNASDVRAAIAREKPNELPTAPLTGLTVPHHLLAADLIARGFWAASGGTYERIVVLLPDHFKKSKLPIATTTRDFATLFGVVLNDARASSSLLRDDKLVEDSSLFEKEHALQALLPFIAEFFPKAKIVPVAISIKSRREDWDAALPLIERLVTPKTLLLQSTDFSHFLPHEIAVQRDQEVLNALAANDVDVVSGFRQPEHLDSIGAQYLQMKLQTKLFGAKPVVIANANSQQYFNERVERSTSYVVQLFCPSPLARSRCGWSAKAKRYFFAGDLLAGRNFKPYLEDEAIGKRLADIVLSITQGSPMIVNLEGVIADEFPESLAKSAMIMPWRTTLDWLTRLNVIGVGLANNHVMDFGADAFVDMKKLLDDAQFITLAHGDPKDFGPFRLVALTDLSTSGLKLTDRLTMEEIDGLPIAGLSAPLIAFVHWGQDGVAAPGIREAYLSAALNRHAVSAIIGAHSHLASEGAKVVGGGETLVVHSLGNFIFDQSGAKASSALVELTFFEQGTFATRLIPMPNLFDVALEASRTANKPGSVGP